MLFTKSFKVFGQSVKEELHETKENTKEKISNSLDALERKVMRGIYSTVDTLAEMKQAFNEGRSKYFEDEVDINGIIIDGEFTVKE